MVAAPFLSRMPRAASAERKFDPDFGAASEAARAVRAGTISSRELTSHIYARIKRYNPRINAFIALLEDGAMARAAEADEALAKGRVWGPLHGLPILVKDQFSTAGARTTYGSRKFASHVPARDAVAVARLKAAGAVIIGKTSLPEFAADHQTYNDIIGVTNNPWDVGRSPGGSTGGGAAALASGMGFLELGTDIGGSLRNPAHFCGVYGHKSSLNLVPSEHPVLPPPGVVFAPSDLGVAGPMARSADDLRLELEVVGGPEPGEAVGFSWRLPAARGKRLRDYRIGYVIDESFCPPTGEVSAVFLQTINALRRNGVRLTEGWPEGFDPLSSFESYYYLLSIRLLPGVTGEVLAQLREASRRPVGSYAARRLAALTSSVEEWSVHHAARFKARFVWSEYFRTHDAFLMPASFTTAFAHDLSQPIYLRQVDTPEGKRMYLDLAKWISVASLSGCPATVAPAGITKSRLPVGIQIMGPYLEDATPISIAGLMKDITSGFIPPPGYSG